MGRDVLKGQAQRWGFDLLYWGNSTHGRINIVFNVTRTRVWPLSPALLFYSSTAAFPGYVNSAALLYPWGFSSNDPSVTREHECDRSDRKALRLNKYSRFYVPLGKYMECLLDFFPHECVWQIYCAWHFFLDIRISAFRRQTLGLFILVNWLHGLHGWDVKPRCWL